MTIDLISLKISNLLSFKKTLVLECNKVLHISGRNAVGKSNLYKLLLHALGYTNKKTTSKTLLNDMTIKGTLDIEFTIDSEQDGGGLYKISKIIENNKLDVISVYYEGNKSTKTIKELHQQYRFDFIPILNYSSSNSFENNYYNTGGAKLKALLLKCFTFQVSDTKEKIKKYEMLLKHQRDIEKLINCQNNNYAILIQKKKIISFLEKHALQNVSKLNRLLYINKQQEILDLDIMRKQFKWCLMNKNPAIFQEQYLNLFFNANINDCEAIQIKVALVEKNIKVLNKLYTDIQVDLVENTTNQTLLETQKTIREYELLLKALELQWSQEQDEMKRHFDSVTTLLNKDLIKFEITINNFQIFYKNRLYKYSSHSEQNFISIITTSLLYKYSSGFKVNYLFVDETLDAFDNKGVVLALTKHVESIYKNVHYISHHFELGKQMFILN